MNTLREQLDGFKDFDFKYIKINGYESSDGRVTDVLLDVNTTYTQAKEEDHESLLEYKDIVEVPELLEVSKDHKDDYDTLWVKSYDALLKGFQPKPPTGDPKPKPPTLCRGCTEDVEKGKCYVSGFVKERSVIREGGVKTPRKKQVLTHFKDHMRKDSLLTSYMVYSPASGSIKLDGETLIIDCNENRV